MQNVSTERRRNRRNRGSKSRQQNKNQNCGVPSSNSNAGRHPLVGTEEEEVNFSGEGRTVIEQIYNLQEDQLQSEGDWLRRIRLDGFSQKSVVTAVKYISKYKSVVVLEEEETKNSSRELSSTAGELQRPLIPSGKREPQQGVENEEQGILSIRINTKGEIVLDITQLVAGFIIGPKGVTIRELSEVCGSRMKSWTVDESEFRRAYRNFVLSGTPQVLLQTLDVMLAAIDRYKQLAEGSCRGQSVNRIQKIKGIDFFYYPPPKTKISYAASIQGAPSGLNGGVCGVDCEQLGDDKFILRNDRSRNKPTASSIQNALQLSSQNVDDVACTHPGIYPQKVYHPRATSGGRRRGRNRRSNNSIDETHGENNNQQQNMDRIVEVPKSTNSVNRNQIENKNINRNSSTQDSQELGKNIFSKLAQISADESVQVAPTPKSLEDIPEIDAAASMQAPKNVCYFFNKKQIKDKEVFLERQADQIDAKKQEIFENVAETSEMVSSVSFTEVCQSYNVPDVSLQNTLHVQNATPIFDANQKYAVNTGSSSYYTSQSFPDNMTKDFCEVNLSGHSLWENMGYGSLENVVNLKNEYCAQASRQSIESSSGVFEICGSSNPAGYTPNAGNVKNVCATSLFDQLKEISILDEVSQEILDFDFVDRDDENRGYNDNLQDRFDSQDALSTANERVRLLDSEFCMQNQLQENLEGKSSQTAFSSGKENFPPTNVHLCSARIDYQYEEQKILDWSRVPQCNSFHPAIGYEIFDKPKEEEQRFTYKLFSPEKYLRKFGIQGEREAVGLQDICKFIGNIIMVPEDQESVCNMVPPSSPQMRSISGESLFTSSSRYACTDRPVECVDENKPQFLDLEKDTQHTP